jgi:hypothetical protein
MPTQRLSMRRIKQLLTMHFGAGASTRAIGRELGIAPSTVREYLGRAAAAGIDWPLAADVTDESLVARLFVNAGVRAGARFHAEPDWPSLVRELKRPGVNLLVLWDEYREVHPEGYAYSRYVAPEIMWFRRQHATRSCGEAMILHNITFSRWRAKHLLGGVHHAPRGRPDGLPERATQGARRFVMCATGRETRCRSCRSLAGTT